MFSYVHSPRVLLNATILFCGSLAIGSLQLGAAKSDAVHVPNGVAVLRPQGFEPSQLNVAANQPFFLIVFNRSGIHNVSVTLDPQHGNRLQQTSVKNNSPHSEQLLTLQPGTYILGEASHPNWTCKVVVK